MSELLNLIGFSMGAVLYAVLLVMVLRVDRRGGLHNRIDPLLLVTSVLGLLWNVTALFPFLYVVGLSALGFLPAVVVHSVLRGEREGVGGAVKRLLAGTAYAVSALAAFVHLAVAASGGGAPSAFGMRLLTYAFVGLVIPLAVVTRNQAGSRRTLWAAALAIFAVSALHLSQLHEGDASWPVELLGHHASLPLAVAILYQDYPFALADLFLKRALALLTIVALAFVAIAAFGAESSSFAQFVRVDPRQVGVLVTLWVTTALLYPAVRWGTAWFVDRIVLHRPNYRSLRAAVIRRLQTQEDVSDLLRDVCTSLAPALSAMTVTWREWDGAEEDGTAPVIVSGNRALVLVATADPPRFAIEVAGLTGGRRLLSDDIATLDAIAIAAARRIDAIRITRERYDREIREQEIAKLASESELRALRAQVNPHFLFNALTTIGYLIQTAPPRALDTLMRLTALLRAVLRSEGEFTTLGREIDLIESYLEIEHARFEQRLRVTVDVPARLRHIRVPPLIVQPLVENAVKHGIAAKAGGGDVTIVARIVDGEATDRHVSVIIRDTGGGATVHELERGRDRGVGLRNVERRLQRQYGGAASLSVHSVPGEGTTVEVRLPVSPGVEAAQRTDRMAV
jgi:signal transduction histidine kinase